VDIFRERILLRSEDNTLRTLILSELKLEVAQHRQPATEEPEKPRVPAGLATFDEGPTMVTEEDAAAAVTPPQRPRRRKRRRGRARRDRKATKDEETSTGSEGDEGGK